MNWSAVRRVLFTHSDMGAIGWSEKADLFSVKSFACRGWAFFDTAHRRHDNFKNNLQHTGVKTLRDEMTAVASIGAAPWGNSGHFGKYSDAVSEIASNLDPDDDLYQRAYFVICWYWYSGVLPPEYGSRDHMVMMFEVTTTAEVFQRQMEAAELGRWYQSSLRWRSVFKYLGMLLFAIVYVGIHNDWWRSALESPLSWDWLRANKALGSV